MKSFSFEETDKHLFTSGDTNDDIYSYTSQCSCGWALTHYSDEEDGEEFLCLDRLQTYEDAKNCWREYHMAIVNKTSVKWYALPMVGTWPH